MFSPFRKLHLHNKLTLIASCDPALSSSANSNSKINTADDTPKQSASEEYHNNGLAYLIAIVTLGTAFGNMFLAGKLRSVMKIRMPKASWEQHSNSGASNPASANPQSHADRKAYDEYMQNLREKMQRAYQQQQRQQVEALVEQDLKNLNLSFINFNEADIKKAYSALARLHHPDVLPKDLSSVAKENHVRKFNQITESYHALLGRIKRDSDNQSGSGT